MSTILHISSSISGNASVSRELGDRLTQRLAEAHGAEIAERDLSTNDVPLIDGLRFEANNTAPEERNTAQSELATISDTLIEELRRADTLVVSIPMYNFGPPASVKAWADLVARVGTTFRYTENGPEGLLTGRTAYIVGTSGGTPLGGEMDYTTTWLRQYLTFLGFEVKDIFTADLIMGEARDQKIAEAKEAIDNLTVPA
ncbi:MAG: NAD(P)H-dependent oxidoreductase [Erythrobacter sp.]